MFISSFVVSTELPVLKYQANNVNQHQDHDNIEMCDFSLNE